MYLCKCILPYDRELYMDENCMVRFADATTIDHTKGNDSLLADTSSITYITIVVDNVIETITLNELGKRLGFIYISRLNFIHESLYRNINMWGFSESGSTSLQHDFNSHALNHGLISSNIYVKYIGMNDDKLIDLGYGVFALSSLDKGEQIGEYVGIIQENYHNKPTTYSMNCPCANGGYEINAFEYGNAMRLINHSKEPNAEFVQVLHEGMIHMVCITIDKIQADQQVTVNYGKSYWQGHNQIDLFDT